MAAGNIFKNMKPTQEEIDKALRFADSKETTGGYVTLKTLDVLSAAYREKCEQLNKQSEIICTKCGLREERGEKPNVDF